MYAVEQGVRRKAGLIQRHGVALAGKIAGVEYLVAPGGGKGQRYKQGGLCKCQKLEYGVGAGTGEYYIRRGEKVGQLL